MKKNIGIVLAMVMLSVLFTVGCSGNKEQKETDADASTVTGVVEEIKDFMFVITDDNQVSYALTFDEKPEGLDKVSVGDQVTVTYTGTLSEVDAFTGEILSVEKQ